MSKLPFMILSNMAAIITANLQPNHQRQLLKLNTQKPSTLFLSMKDLNICTLSNELRNFPV